MEAGGLPGAPAALVLQAEGGWGDAGSPRSPRTPRGPASVLAAVPAAPGGVGKVPLGLLVALEHASVPVDGRRSSLIRFGPPAGAGRGGGAGDGGAGESTLVAFRHLGREVLLVLILPAAASDWEGEAAARVAAEALLTLVGSCAAWQGRATRAALEHSAARLARKALHCTMLNLFGPRYPTHPLPLELPDVGRRARGWGGQAPRLRECASEALRRVHALLHKEAVVGRLPFWVQTTALFHQGTLIHTVEDGASAEGPCAPAAHLRAVWMACWALRLFCRGPQQADLRETLEIGALEGGGGGQWAPGDAGSGGPAIAPRALVAVGSGEDLLCCLFRPGHPGTDISEGMGHVPVALQHSLEALRGSVGGNLSFLLTDSVLAPKPGTQSGPRPGVGDAGSPRETPGGGMRLREMRCHTSASGVITERWPVSDTVHEALAGPSESELNSLRHFYSGLLRLATELPACGPGPEPNRRDTYAGLAEGARAAQQRAEELQAGDPRAFPRAAAARGLAGLEEVTLFAGPPGCPLGARACCRLARPPAPT